MPPGPVAVAAAPGDVAADDRVGDGEDANIHDAAAVTGSRARVLCDTPVNAAHRLVAGDRATGDIHGAGALIHDAAAVALVVGTACAAHLEIAANQAARERHLRSRAFAHNRAPIGCAQGAALGKIIEERAVGQARGRGSVVPELPRAGIVLDGAAEGVISGPVGRDDAVIAEKGIGDRQAGAVVVVDGPALLPPIFELALPPPSAWLSVNVQATTVALPKLNTAPPSSSWPFTPTVWWPTAWLPVSVSLTRVNRRRPD